jgi:hypothetical protein
MVLALEIYAEACGVDVRAQQLSDIDATLPCYNAVVAIYSRNDVGWSGPERDDQSTQ